MLKTLVIFFVAIIFVSECSIIKDPSYVRKNVPEFFNDPFEVESEMRSTYGKAADLGPHVMDFLNLINLEKMTMTAMLYMNDPEVLTFMKFLFSAQFKDLIWDFESMKEFKEAVSFLGSKGYDVESVLNFVNTVLNLPPFEKSNFMLRNKKGISGFLEAMFNTLPHEEMKDLFENKLQNHPEVAELFETINSKEFMEIMKRMRDNPKFMEFKLIFEAYGFDFKHICESAKEVFGEYYQGVFCE